MAIQIRERRELLHLSQRDLAASVRISRQALNAIEGGRARPSVDVALRIALALETSVEELFGEARDAWSIRARESSPGTSSRRVVARIHGRWVSHALGDREHDIVADGVVENGKVQLFQAPARLHDNVIVMGCAPALGVLAEQLNAQHGNGKFIWLPRTSKEGIAALLAGASHFAGMHLTNADGTEANRAHSKGARPAIALNTFARWEVGLVVAAGNPKRIRRASDVAARGVRVVNREADASPRRLLERRLRAEGTKAPPNVLIAIGHREVARAVAMGAADVGPAVRDVAIAYGLDFIPLSEERFDLAVTDATLQTPQARRLLEALTSSRTRRELAALGYDVRQTGVRVCA